MIRATRIAALVTLGVFALGIAQIQVLSGRDALLPWPRLFLWLMFVVCVGGALGLFMSAVNSMFAYARERPAPRLLGVPFLIGLNIAGVTLLWLLPAVF